MALTVEQVAGWEGLPLNDKIKWATVLQGDVLQEWQLYITTAKESRRVQIDPVVAAELLDRPGLRQRVATLRARFGPKRTVLSFHIGDERTVRATVDLVSIKGEGEYGTVELWRRTFISMLLAFRPTWTEDNVAAKMYRRTPEECLCDWSTMEQALLQSVVKCNCCGKRATRQCKCKTAAYCCREHQVKHWKFQRIWCSCKK